MNKITVIGAGIMGRGIAQKIAMSGINVDLFDINQAQLDSAIINISDNLEEAISKHIIEENKKDEMLGHIDLKNSIDDIDPESTMVIEAITEDLTAKVKLYESLERVCSKDTIFVTNTSCLSVTDLAMQTERKDKFIGMHFFYPAEKNKLIEIIPTSHTSPDVIREAVKLSDLIDKVYIRVKDTPGFVVNRYFVALLNEVSKILEIYPEQIYLINLMAKEAFDSPLGPFEIMNLTGTALAYKTTLELSERLGDIYTPAPLLEEYGKENRNWEYPEHPTSDDMEYLNSSLAHEIKSRIIGLVIAVCYTMLSEEVTTASDINLGARIGLGWKKPPFELLSRMETEEIEDCLASIDVEYPELTIEDTIAGVKEWKVSYTDYISYDSIARIRLKRPHVLNALSKELFIDLNKDLDKALEDSSIRIISIEGFPKVFSAGADLKFFMNCLETRRTHLIDEYTELAHQVLAKIITSPKPVIAMIDGMAIGGGLELALSCHFIVATERSMFQFPETELGLFPGFGGTQSLPKRVGVELARYLILLGYKITSIEALEFGLIDKYIKNYSEYYDFLDEISIYKGIGINTLMDHYKDATALTGETVKNIRLLRDVDLLLSRRLISRRAKKLSEQLDTRSPKAIMIANYLINKAMDLSLEEGMALEREHVQEVFQQPELLDNFKKVFLKQKKS